MRKLQTQMLAAVACVSMFALGCQNKDLEVDNALTPAQIDQPVNSVPGSAFVSLPSGATALTTTTHGYKVTAQLGQMTTQAAQQTTHGYTVVDPAISQ